MVSTNNIKGMMTRVQIALSTVNIELCVKCIVVYIFSISASKMKFQKIYSLHSSHEVFILMAYA